MKNPILYLCFLLFYIPFVNAQSINHKTKRAIQIDSAISKWDKKVRIWKFTPWAIFAGYTSLGFEKSLKDRRSLEFNLGIVGAGFKWQGGSYEQSLKQLGATVTAGYKFMFPDDVHPDEKEFKHRLKAAYFRPDVTFGFYREKYIHRIYSPNSPERVDKTENSYISYLSIVPTIGTQKINRRGFVWDIFIGVGVGINFPTHKEAAVSNFGRYGVYLSLHDENKKERLIVPALKIGFLVGGLF